MGRFKEAGEMEEEEEEERAVEKTGEGKNTR